MTCATCSAPAVVVGRFRTDMAPDERNWFTVYWRCQKGHEFSETKRGGWSDEVED